MLHCFFINTRIYSLKKYDHLYNRFSAEDKCRRNLQIMYGYSTPVTIQYVLIVSQRFSRAIPENDRPRNDSIKEGICTSSKEYSKESCGCFPRLPVDGDIGERNEKTAFREKLQ